MNDILLNNLLQPLRSFLDNKEVSEIAINKPHEIWIDDGKKQSFFHNPILSFSYLCDLAQQIATNSEQKISEEHPLLSANLPTGERVQIVFPPAVRWIEENGDQQPTISFSIRKQSILNYDLTSYSKGGGFARIQNETEKTNENNITLQTLFEQKRFDELLKFAVNHHKTILISGATFSGKTSYLNMLLKEIPISERIISIEDTPEVYVSQPNRVRLFYSRGGQGRAMTLSGDLVTASLRMRPDRIIMGELRGDDAVDWLAAANSGHAGTLSTIHSDDPHMAIEKLVLMVMKSHPGLSQTEIRRYVCSIVDMVIQIKRDTNGKRYTSSILLTSGLT